MQNTPKGSYVPVIVPRALCNEMDKLVPGTYINRTELVLKAVRKLLIEEHGVKF